MWSEPRFKFLKKQLKSTQEEIRFEKQRADFFSIKQNSGFNFYEFHQNQCNYKSMTSELTNARLPVRGNVYNKSTYIVVTSVSMIYSMISPNFALYR